MKYFVEYIYITIFIVTLFVLVIISYLFLYAAFLV